MLPECNLRDTIHDSAEVTLHCDILCGPEVHRAGPIHFPFQYGDKAIQSYMEKRRAIIASAKNILIVGGGVVGIEMAGAIKHFYPTEWKFTLNQHNTKIMLVHGSKVPLLNKAYPDKFRQAVEHCLEQANSRPVTQPQMFQYLNRLPSSPILQPGKTQSEFLLPFKFKVIQTSLPLEISLTSQNIDRREQKQIGKTATIPP
ncbi:hypothetical protein DL96DRAFT_1560990 [Flagelloscypha sp. PMI_526]|nr:hypothetical protein DL96DRAFT_1560990 [Flagelloscypha sp. PMI_526]